MVLRLVSRTHMALESRKTGKIAIIFFHKTYPYKI
jgi:hypothetical protein